MANRKVGSRFTEAKRLWTSATSNQRAGGVNSVVVHSFPAVKTLPQSANICFLAPFLDDEDGLVYRKISYYIVAPKEKSLKGMKMKIHMAFARGKVHFISQFLSDPGYEKRDMLDGTWLRKGPNDLVMGRGGIRIYTPAKEGFHAAVRDALEAGKGRLYRLNDSTLATLNTAVNSTFYNTTHPQQTSHSTTAWRTRQKISLLKSNSRKLPF